MVLQVDDVRVRNALGTEELDQGGVAAVDLGERWEAVGVLPFEKPDHEDPGAAWIPAERWIVNHVESG